MAADQGRARGGEDPLAPGCRRIAGAATGRVPMAEDPGDRGGCQETLHPRPAHVV